MKAGFVGFLPICWVFGATWRIYVGWFCRMEEVGYMLATDVQREALPALFSGRDCVLHAQVDLLFAH